MQVIWKLGKATVRDIMATYDPPLPKYTTISSAVRILEEKEFVNHKAYGRTHEYFPIITKAAYKQFAFARMVHNYFDNSYAQMVSFVAEKGSLSPEERDALQALIEKGGKDD